MMRKITLLTIMCLMILAYVAVSTHAKSSYSKTTGKTCGYCHIDTGGGGPLTSAGQYYLDNGTLPPSTTPAAPTALAASAGSANQINLTWTDNSSDETGFIVERSASSGGTFTAIATLGANAASYNNTGLSASTTYYYRVCATNSAGNSAYTNTASAATSAPPVTKPAAPTKLAATAASASQINLAWTDNSSNETGFIVERSASSGGTFTAIATLGSNVTTYSNTGLNASTTYYYRVCAANSAGNSTYSNTALATTSATPATIPIAPSDLTATAALSTEIDLQWIDNSTDETGFIIERAASASGTFTAIATVGSNVTNFTNTGLAASATYYYRICATNGAGNSGYTNTAFDTTPAAPVTIPIAPTSLAASAVSGSQINLTWTDNSNNESGFIVERAASSSGAFTAIATLGSNITTYSNTGLSASTTYFYRVCAANSAGNSAYTNTASAATSAAPVTKPAAPGTLAASAVSASRIDLTWTDNSNNESEFKVERAATSGGAFTVIATVGSGITTYSNTGLSASTTYYYRVCATNSAGDSAYSNMVSAATSAVTPPSITAPKTPSNLIASAVSSNQIKLIWKDNSSNESGFRIERSLRSGSMFTLITTVGADVTTYTDSGLSASRRYYYRVQAVNSAGKSGYSNSSSAATSRANNTRGGHTGGSGGSDTGGTKPPPIIRTRR
ncbi:MAG: fibronectin type III domain-containing protein [Armatimonadota bacterium]